MAWQDRVREAAYTAPSGTRTVFLFEAVSSEVSKRTAAFEFPGVDEAYVQDNGHGPRRFPLRCIFSGADHDLDAAAFEDALLERGVGRLEHPFYGSHDVVPFGDISRRDDLKEEANQTVIEVTFWTSVSSVYPEIQTARRSEVLAGVEAFAEAAAIQFEEAVDLSTVAAQANVQTRTQGGLTQVSAALSDASKATEAVNRELQDGIRAINDGITVLVGQPLQLATQVVGLVVGPAKSSAGIRDRLDGYADLASRIIAAPTSLPAEAFLGGIVLPGRRRTVANDFHLAVVMASSAVIGSVVAVVETQFVARPDALAAAELLFEQLDAVVTWMDAGFDALGAADAPGGVDTGRTYQALQETVALAAGYLVEISFSLRPERRIVLDRPRTVIDLAAELYGQVDERLEYLITTNDLSGSEILELPRGRSIAFYA